MPNESLPEKLHPFRLAEKGLQLQGLLFIKNMTRLAESLAKTEGEVNVRASFGIDEEGIQFIKAGYATGLTLECQRCLQPFVYEITDNFIFGLVATEEEASRLPKRYDPILVKDDLLLIQELVEDELIVHLPIVPMHEEEGCGVKLPLSVGVEMAEGEKRESPFKVIEFLQSNRAKRDSDK